MTQEEKEIIASCVSARRTIKGLDESGWKYRVQVADVEIDGERVESVGISARKGARRMVAAWSRKNGGRWTRMPGFIWGRIERGTSVVMVWLVARPQAEMRAWVEDEETWWTKHLLARPQGSWTLVAL